MATMFIYMQELVHMDRKALKGQLRDRLTCGEVKWLTFAASQTLPVL